MVNAYTLNRAFDSYTKNRLFTHDIAPNTQESYLLCYRKHIAPVLGSVPLADIKPVMIYDFLDSLRDAACNLSIVVLQRIQKVAIRAGKIEAPFCFDVDRRVIRKRNDMIEDLPAFLEFLHTDQYRSYKNALKAQLLYGTRANEIYQIEWSEVEEDVINIDCSRVKNRRVALKQTDPLVIPILPMMADILQEQRGLSTRFVFPMLSKDRPTDNNIIFTFLKSNGFKFSSHSIRRTVTTLLRNELGATVDDVNIITDHSLGAVNQAYMIGSPVETKRRILSKWHSYLTEIMNPGVTIIKAANTR